MASSNQFMPEAGQWHVPNTFSVLCQVLNGSKPTYLGIELPFDINLLLAVVRMLCLA